MSVEFLKALIYVGSTLMVAEIMRQIRLRKKVKEMVLTTVRHNLREKYGYELKRGITIKMEIYPYDILTEDNFMRYYITLNKAVMQEIIEMEELKPIKNKLKMGD